jgi:ectoine hydroxylase-related dioxygenase (phytanoyl-CoA dioxygenase family)
MDIDQAIAAYGADQHTLTQEQKAALDDQGFLVVPSVLEPELCARIRARMDAIAAAEGEAAGADFHKEQGVIRLGNLMNKDPLFDIIYTHPLMLACVRHLTRGEFGVSSVTGRIALPGQGLQGFHQDFNQEVRPGVRAPGELRAANVLWLIDEFTADNGPTRVIPGSHLIRGTGPEILGDTQATHPREQRVIAPQGSMLAFDAFLWHAGTTNQTTAKRRMANAMCQPRTHYQQWFDRHVTPEAAARIGEAGRYILDHPIRATNAPKEPVREAALTY